MKPLLQSCLLLSVISVSLCGIGRDISRGITKEIAAAKQPVEEALVHIGSSQCQNVKRIIGVAYDQVDDNKEPDVNKLTLVLSDNAYHTVFNLSYDAKYLVEFKKFNLRQKLVMFLHGFTDDPTKSSYSNISDAFLKRGGVNVMGLDASSLIGGFYLRSTTYIRFIGEKLGQFLAAMVENGVDPAQIHIVGHSLGSHISGFTAKTFQNITGKKINRISGLDPAGPCFSHVEPDLRLKKTDAEFVDVIHTDGGVYGLKDAVGHVDYYPNGGKEQPNCLFQTCSHSRAWLYFSESVLDPKAFPGVMCDSWDHFRRDQCGKIVNYMGLATEHTPEGSYYLQTAESSPYALGENGTRYKNDGGILDNIAYGSKDLAHKTANLFG